MGGFSLSVKEELLMMIKGIEKHRHDDKNSRALYFIDEY